MARPGMSVDGYWTRSRSYLEGFKPYQQRDRNSARPHVVGPHGPVQEWLSYFVAYSSSNLLGTGSRGSLPLQKASLSYIKSE